MPDNIELRIDRAITLASLDRYWEAIDDLNLANEQAPGRADILVYRASAYRQVEAYDLAMEDANQALDLDPSNAEGFLERGLLNFARGDLEAARSDWRQIMLIAPGTPAAQIAEENLTALRQSESGAQ
jgi:tetratricopeptide (TPR) repeat protein